MRRHAIAILLLLIVAPVGLTQAQVVPVGGEFQVNTFTTSYQLAPAVAVNAAGQFVIVWADLYGQDGDGPGVFARRYDSAGGLLGAEFQVNAHTTGVQFRPAAALDENGNFVVVWDHSGQDGDSYGVFARFFDSTGGALSDEFQVNTYTTGFQGDPTAASNPAGQFVLAWLSDGQDGSASGVFAQLYDIGGGPAGEEFQVNTYTTALQDSQAMAMDADGGFVVVWTSWPGDGSYSGIFGQRYDSSGSALGVEFQVNTWTTYHQQQPAVGMDGEGHFVVAWTSGLQDSGTYGVFARRYDSLGNTLGGEFQVNTYTTGEQNSPALAVDGAGNFGVVWSSSGQDGDGAGVFGRVFDSAGTPLAAEFQVNTYTTGAQNLPAVAADGAGDFVVAWQSYGQDGSFTGVFGQQFFVCTVEQCDGLDNDCDGLTDEMGVCTGGFTITSPLDGGTVDCSDPALSRPTITWDLGDYDQFKVYMGSSPGFEKGTRVTSGDKKILTGSWMPSKKKWKSACNKALSQAADPNSPEMFIAVLGKDSDLSKKDPLKKLFSFTVRTLVAP